MHKAKVQFNQFDYKLYYIHVEITGDPCNQIGSHWYNLHTNCTIVFSKLHLFPSQWGSCTKIQQPIRFFSKKPIKLQENEQQLQQLSSNPHSTGSIKYLYADKIKPILWATEFWDFKMDIIKPYLDFMSCNFGLKTYLWFQIKVMLCTCLTLKSHNMILHQIALQSVQFLL